MNPVTVILIILSVCSFFVFILYEAGNHTGGTTTTCIDDKCLECDLWGRSYTDKRGEKRIYCLDCPHFRELYPPVKK